jgi:RNA polymerase sigma-B factor
LTLGANVAVRRRPAVARTRRYSSGQRRASNLDQKTLLRGYHEKGDLAAREQLITQSMPLVRSLARRYAYRGEQLEDLVQIGAIGLIKAIDRFDLDRGVPFNAYASAMIIGEVRRHFRDGGSVRVPRSLQELNAELSRHSDRLGMELGRTPTLRELAEAAGVEEEEALEALRSGRTHRLLSLSLKNDGREEDSDPLELMGGEDHEYEAAEDRAVLAPAVKTLDDREQKILQLYFYEELTQSQVAHEVGLSQMHVSRLIQHALEHIRHTVADATG